MHLPSRHFWKHDESSQDFSVQEPVLMLLSTAKRQRPLLKHVLLCMQQCLLVPLGSHTNAFVATVPSGA